MAAINQNLQTLKSNEGSALNFRDLSVMELFCKIIPGMDASRYDPVEIKISLEGDLPLVTLFAKDKSESEKQNSTPKQQIKEFNTSIHWNDFFKVVRKLLHW